MWTLAFASGAIGPSIEVVRKIRLPETIGDEWPRPGIAIFQRTFLESLHSSGRSFSAEIAAAPGPRHCGQSPARAKATRRQESARSAAPAERPHGGRGRYVRGFML